MFSGIIKWVSLLALIVLSTGLFHWVQETRMQSRECTDLSDSKDHIKTDGTSPTAMIYPTLVSRSPYINSTSPKKKKKDLTPPQLENQLLEKFIVVPEHKLLFCYVEKTGCSMFSHLFRMVRLFHPTMKDHEKEARFQSQCTWRRNEPKHHRKSRKQLEKMLMDPKWTKAVFFRDPISRFVSAFRSKCGGVDGDGQKHCEAAFGRNLTGSVEDFRSAVDSMKSSTERTRRAFQNPHFAPTSRFCGGLKHTLDHYDFVHLLDKKTAPDLVRQLLLHIGVRKNDTEYLIDNVVRTGGTHIEQDQAQVKSRLGIKLHRSDTNSQSHNTGSRKSFDDYFGHSSRLDILQKKYKMDYDLFGLPMLDLKDLEIWLEVGGNMTAMADKSRRNNGKQSSSSKKQPCARSAGSWDSGF